jgi:hypothetical protein
LNQNPFRVRRGGGVKKADSRLLEQFLDEHLQLAEAKIRKPIDYLIGSLPSFFKERLVVCCCET